MSDAEEWVVQGFNTEPFETWFEKLQAIASYRLDPDTWGLNWVDGDSPEFAWKNGPDLDLETDSRLRRDGWIAIIRSPDPKLGSHFNGWMSNICRVTNGEREEYARFCVKGVSLGYNGEVLPDPGQFFDASGLPLDWRPKFWRPA